MREFVVCILRKPWVRITTGEVSSGPEYGKVYTVRQRRVVNKGLFQNVPVLNLTEFGPCWFVAKHFRPVQYDLQEVFNKKHLEVDA